LKPLVPAPRLRKWRLGPYPAKFVSFFSKKTNQYHNSQLKTSPAHYDVYHTEKFGLMALEMPVNNDLADYLQSGFTA